MFHYQYQTYFGRRADGSVRIVHRVEGVPPVYLVDADDSSHQADYDFDATVDADGWASIVAAVSLGGANDGRTLAARQLHNTRGPVHVVLGPERGPAPDPTAVDAIAPPRFTDAERNALRLAWAHLDDADACRVLERLLHGSACTEPPKATLLTVDERAALHRAQAVLQRRRKSAESIAAIAAVLREDMEAADDDT